MGPASLQNSSREPGRIISRLDRFLDRLYSYQGEIRPPEAARGDTWAAPPRLLSGKANPADYFLHYFQSQGLGPTPNECVTTSTVMAMNIMEDRLGSSGNLKADLRIEDFTRTLDLLGISAWRLRFSSLSPLPGMMPPGGARRAMKAHAARLRRELGRSYRVETRSGLTLDDLIHALEQGTVVLLHGAWQKRLSDPKDRHLALLGGMPHTMLLAGYQPGPDTWHILNPADPWLISRAAAGPSSLFRMTTPQLVDFWGRRFIFYPPRFASTFLTAET